jgi:phospholipid transport system transporter-binding protein
MLAETAPGRVAVTGPMTFATVTELRRDGRRLLRAAGGDVVFDLAGVEPADSAGLALLVDWLSCAHARACQLHYEHVPPTLRALAALSDVLPLITAAQ